MISDSTFDALWNIFCKQRLWVDLYSKGDFGAKNLMGFTAAIPFDETCMLFGGYVSKTADRTLVLLTPDNERIWQINYYHDLPDKAFLGDVNRITKDVLYLMMKYP